MRILIGVVGSVAALAAVTGCSNNNADPQPSGSTVGPLTRNICQEVNMAITALEYFSIGQPPPTKAQLDQAADAVEKQKASAPASAQDALDKLASNLRQLGNTPPGQRANSPAGQQFNEAYKLFASYCNLNGVPLPSTTPSVS